MPAFNGISPEQYAVSFAPALFPDEVKACSFRDLKGENILQSSSGRWVLCDFGSAQTIDIVPGNKDFRGLTDLVNKMTTAVYRAPEVSSAPHIAAISSRQSVNTSCKQSLVSVYRPLGIPCT